MNVCLIHSTHKDSSPSYRLLTNICSPVCTSQRPVFLPKRGLVWKMFLNTLHSLFTYREQTGSGLLIVPISPKYMSLPLCFFQPSPHPPPLVPSSACHPWLTARGDVQRRHVYHRVNLSSAVLSAKAISPEALSHLSHVLLHSSLSFWRGREEELTPPPSNSYKHAFIEKESMLK